MNKNRTEITPLRRAGRTFLQTLTGMLCAYLTAAAAGRSLTLSGWETALFLLLGSAVSAAAAFLMNRADRSA